MYQRKDNTWGFFFIESFIHKKPIAETINHSFISLCHVYNTEAAPKTATIINFY